MRRRLFASQSSSISLPLFLLLKPSSPVSAAAKSHPSSLHLSGNPTAASVHRSAAKGRCRRTAAGPPPQRPLGTRSAGLGAGQRGQHTGQPGSTHRPSCKGSPYHNLTNFTHVPSVGLANTNSRPLQPGWVRTAFLPKLCVHIRHSVPRHRLLPSHMDSVENGPEKGQRKGGYFVTHADQQKVTSVQ